MDDSVAARSDDEPIPSLTDESGEYPIESVEESDDDLPELTLDPEARARVALRDRLVLRVFEEEFLSISRLHGDDILNLMQFETDPTRICARLGLEFRAKLIEERVTRINNVLGLKGLERITSRLEGLHDAVSKVRYDWLRRKVQARAEARRRRGLANAPNADDLLWHHIIKR